MNRYAVFAALVFLALVIPVRAGAPGPLPWPVERALRVPVVVVGTVTSIEKDAVEAVPYYGGKDKRAHKIAVVKIDSNLAGADHLTHIRVGQPVPLKPSKDRPWRGEPMIPQLREGQVLLLFLVPNADAGIHAMPFYAPPLDEKEVGYKQELASVKHALAVVADPMKALASEKAEDRFQAAVMLIARYRTPPEGVPKVEHVAIDAAQSRLILKCLTEGKWDFHPRLGRLTGMNVFFQLGLDETDGWKPNRNPEVDRSPQVYRELFTKWLEGPGKDYRLKKYVPKK